MKQNIMDEIWNKIKLKNQDADLYLKAGDSELIYNRELKSIAGKFKAGDLQK